jgi:SAM-dependent methyltransferase
VRAAYDAVYASSPFRDRERFYRLLARRVLAFLPETGAASILDAGCGGGYLLRELGQAAVRSPRPPPVLHGLEVSAVALREARRQAPSARLVLARAEEAPYGGGCFDAVTCLGSLEHFLDPARGARELARVCRPDGRVWLLLPNSFYSGAIWRVITRGYGPDHHQPVERLATVNEWRDFLEANGLIVEEIAPYNRFKWWKRLLPRNLAWHFLYRARPATR